MSLILMPAPFDLPFVQRAVLEVALLSVGAGLLGTWIVLRGLSFYAHAVGTAAFPGLVLADGVGFSASLGAFATAGVVALLVAMLARRRESTDAATALVLAAALAAGVILASDVFHSQASVERLLFGSLLLVDTRDHLLAGAMSLSAVAVGAVLGRRWLAAGFDPGAARALGARSAVPDVVRLRLIGLGAIAVLDAVGALLATALLVVPAATTRLVSDRLVPWQLATIALALAEGVAGVWLAVETNAPPGATVAVIGAAVFALVALASAIPARRRRRAGRALVAVASVAAAAVPLAGCAGGTASGDGGTKVVVTTTQLADVVREISGGAVSVTQLLKPNTDPHNYEPRPRDIVDAAGAELVVTSGDGLDKWIGDLLDNAGGNPTVLDAGAAGPDGLAGENGERYAPHWWHDPRNVEHAVRRIHDALVRAEPSARGRIDRATNRYLAKLRTLDRGIERCVAAIPPAQRKLVTDHDALGYFARRYGLRIVGAVVPAQTTQAQPSAGDLADLSRVIRREHVRAVFPETSVSPKLAEAIARQTGASARYELYGDTLGPQGSAGATYVGMERANADAIVRGLTGGARGCDIPGIA